MIFARILSICIGLCLLPLAALSKDFSTDFSRVSTQFKVPHRYNTPRQAAKVEDGVLSMRIAPGMHGASSDKKNGKERAEYGIFLNDRDVWVRQTFKVRASSGFPEYQSLPKAYHPT